MKRKRIWLFLVMSIAWMLFYVGPFAMAAEREHAMTVGKTTEVQFQSEVTVEGLPLEPGRYKLQHRVYGADHFMHFTNGKTGGVIDVLCKLEHVGKKASQTSVSIAQVDGGLRVTRIVIAGENVAHVF